MMYNKITSYFLFLFCFIIGFASAQQNKTDWTSISESAKSQISNISFDETKMPTTFNLYNVNIKSLNNKLQNAPIIGKSSGKSSSIISIPNADNTHEDYRVYDTQILHPKLAAQLPNMKSYVGRSIKNTGKFIRFSVSQAGFHGQIFEPGKSTYYIDPYTSNKRVYIAYKRKDLVNSSSDIFSCETDNSFDKTVKNTPINKSLKATDDGIVRRYELAMSCTGEYGALFIGNATTDFDKKSNILAQMIITMTRVNGIYEKELGITYQFVPNNFDIMYYDPTTDPFDGEYNDKTQEVIDANIGDENYDIGHNFNTDGGGNAGCIGCVCNSGNKGSGMTGRGNPTGDSFDVDYVAHEIGHQMGGYHTHNGTTTCLKSGNNTEVEPGSGSSIMGYAGICTGQNVQDNSDDYFNYVNIRDISANVQGGVSSSCFETITVSNLAPTADAGADYIIPVGTAFELKGIGTDVDTEDVLTYTWEQNDSEDMQSPLVPLAVAVAGPMFRSRAGTTSPSRFFPQLSDILDNNLAPTWEVIPEVTRDFEFALTVRDNVLYGGQTADDLLQITSDLNAGPFVVSSQNDNTTWVQGSTETITWDVANTNNTATVNSQTVHILFSAVGDFSDTITLKSDTPNDGSEDILVPGNTTEKGKLMIKAADNIFLDVNNATIRIEEVLVPTFFITALETSKITCANKNTATFTFEYSASPNFTGVVSFDSEGKPENASVSFSPTSINTAETQTVTMTVTNFETAASKEYPIAFLGASAIETKTAPITLILKGTNFEVPALNFPADGSVGQSTYPRYSWSSDASGTAESYVLEVAADVSFSTIIETAVSTTNAYTQKSGLLEGTSYFWRVQPNNECGEGVFTSGNSFTTGFVSCLDITKNLPNPIISTLTTSSTINITEDIPISDININISITHAYIGDIVIDLVSPLGTKVTLIASQCDANDDMNATFDDAGEPEISCVETPIAGLFGPSIEGVFKPMQPLSAFNGESSIGAWTLNITDTGLGDDGVLTSWGIEYCGVQGGVLSATSSLEKAQVIMYPNPATDVVSIQFDDLYKLKVTIYDVIGREVFSKLLKKSNKNIDISSLGSGTYIVQITNKNNEKIIKKLIVK